MKNIYNLFIIFLINFSLSNSQIFQEVQTPYKFVHDIKFLDKNLLFVSGDSVPIDIYAYSSFIPYIGSGFYLSEDMGNLFTGPYLDGYSVFDLYHSSLNSQMYFASVFKFNRGGICKTENGPKTWTNTPLQEDVKLFQKFASFKQNNQEIIFITHPNSSDGISFSTDNFETIQKPDFISSQVYDFKVSNKLNAYFLATDNANFGHVVKIDQNGMQKDLTGLEGLRVLCVQPSEYHPGYVYCGADSITSQKVSIGKGIFYSIDTGKTWKIMTAKGYQVFEIKEHPSDPNYLAAACGKIGVGISGNYGKWFDTFSDGLPEGFDVRKIAIPDLSPTKDGIQVYASLLNGGLYKSKNLTSNINDDLQVNSRELIIENIYPNPVSNEFTLLLNIGNSQKINISIIDYSGKVVRSENLDNLNQGINSITFQEINLSNGKYLIFVSNGFSIRTSSLIILK